MMRAGADGTAKGRLRRLERAAGSVSIAAGAVHGVAAPEHLEEWWGYGLFFLAAGAAQILFGLALLTRAIRPESWGPRWKEALRALYASGIVGNLLIILLYVITRTVGIPFFGPEAGEREPVGFIDVVSKALELVLIAMLIGLLVLESGAREGEASAP